MTVLLRLVVLAGALLTTGSSFAQENLAFNPPSEWKPGNVQQTKDRMVMEFVKNGETVENWTELITVHQYRLGKKSQTYRESFEGLKANWQERCPDLTRWEVIDDNEDLFLYEWKTTGTCAGQPPQTELVRLLFGRKTGYRVGYNTRGEITPEMRAMWIEWLHGVSLKR